MWVLGLPMHVLMVILRNPPQPCDANSMMMWFYSLFVFWTWLTGEVNDPPELSEFELVFQLSALDLKLGLAFTQSQGNPNSPPHACPFPSGSLSQPLIFVSTNPTEFSNISTDFCLIFNSEITCRMKPFLFVYHPLCDWMTMILSIF